MPFSHDITTTRSGGSRICRRGGGGVEKGVNKLKVWGEAKAGAQGAKFPEALGFRALKITFRG